MTQDRSLPDHQGARQPIRVQIETASTDHQFAGNSSVFVGAVSIAGLRSLAPGDFSDLVATKIGQTLSANELRSLASTIADRLHGRGYTFASAWIEPQRLAAGVLTVKVDEGRIDEVRFTGDAPDSVRHALAPLVGDEPVRLEQVERRLMIADDIDGVRIQGSRYVREGDRGILIVDVRIDRVGLTATLTNEGTRPIGREQARFQLDLNGVLASDDSVTITYSTAPAQPRELQFGHMRYAKRLNRGGTEVAFAASTAVTHPGAYLKPLDLKNRSFYAGASLLRPLLRRRKASFWLEGEIGIRRLAQWKQDVRVRNDHLTTARLTFYGYTDVAGGRLRTSATIAQGLDLFDATEKGDPLASRADADSTFTTISLWSDWTGSLGGSFSHRVAAQAQFASQPLLISEEAGLGGTFFVRGYDWSERSGDQGLMGLAELRYDINKPLRGISRAQLYVFVDAGRVSNHRGGFGGGSLTSTGGGVRLDLGSNTSANLELAIPLSGPRYDTGRKNPKLIFAISHSF